MKKKTMMCLVIALMMISVSASALSYVQDGNTSGYEVGIIRPGGDRPCTLFTLVDVSQSDASLVPGSPWFVIEDTSPEYNQMIATLLTAKATGRRIQVQTTGTVSSSCWHPKVSVILML